MKTLGTLGVGDKVLFINYIDVNEINCIESVERNTVQYISDLKHGRVIGYISERDGRTRELNIYPHQFWLKALKSYTYHGSTIVCPNKDIALDIIKEDKEKQMGRYNKMMANLK